MTAFRLLDLAEQRGLLDPATLVKLREQLASMQRSVSVTEMADMLVKRGRLTDFQAKSLVESVREVERAKAEGVDLMADTGSVSSLELLEDSDEELMELEAVPIAEAVSPPPVAEVVESSDEPILMAVDDAGVVDDASDLTGETGSLADMDELGAGESTDRSIGRAKLNIKSLFTRRKGWQRGRGGPDFVMLGGGALVLLSLLGALLYFFLTRETGDEFFKLAQADYAEQSYNQALEKYDSFIEKFPKHPNFSLAVVRRELASMRRSVQSGNWADAQSAFESGIAKMTPEPAFKEGKPELAGILPEIYEGFAKSADRAGSADQKEEQLANAEAIRMHIDNPDYLGAQRASIDVRVSSIEKLTDKVRRDISRERDLATALTEMESSVSDNNTIKAYAVHKRLLDQYPGLRANEVLTSKLGQIAAAERSSVVVSPGNRKSASVDHKLTAPNRVLLARRRTKSKAGASGQVGCLVHGALFGLDASTGGALWRRWLGFESTKEPVAITQNGATSILAIDDQRHELLLLDGATGKLKWRLSIGEACAQPVFAGRIYVSTESGKLMAIDATTGNLLQVASLPQSLYSPPFVSSTDGGHSQLFQAGGHSSVYVFDAESLECQSVHATGHTDGAVVRAPFVIGRQLIVPEQSGADATALLGLPLANDGTISPGAGVTSEVRIEGFLTSAVRLNKNRSLLTTDLGTAYVLGFDASESTNSLQTIAMKKRSSESSTNHFGLAFNDQIFIAGRGLGRFELQAANGSLVSRWEMTDPSLHIAPPKQLGDTIVVQYQRPGSRAVRVASLSFADGDNTAAPNWTTDLGAAPAGPAFVDKQARGIIAVSRDASAWKIGGKALSNRVLDQVEVELPGRTTFGSSQELGNNHFYAATKGRTGYLVYDESSRASKLQRNDVQIPDSELACPLVASGALESTAGGSRSDQVIACASSGAVYVLDAKSGKPATAAFRATTNIGTRVNWVAPAVLDDGSFVAGTKSGSLTHLHIADGKLSPRSVKRHELSLLSRLVAVNDTVFAITKAGPVMSLTSFQLPALDLQESVPFSEQHSQRFTSGPYRVGDQVVCVTGGSELHSVGATGKLNWSVKLLDSPLAGPPVEMGKSWLLASANGILWRIDPRSGDTMPWKGGDAATSFDVGEPLGASPLVMGSRVIALGRDCTAFVLSLK